MNSLLGTKRGTTQLWRENGTRVPVTVLDVSPNTVTAIRTLEKNGYEAVQIGAGSIRPGAQRRVSMALTYEIGQKFPSMSLVDDREREVSIEEVAGGRPLILAFYRGPW